MTFLTGILLAGLLGVLVLAAVIVVPLLTGMLVSMVLMRLAWLLALLWVAAWFLVHGRRNGSGWERLDGVRYAHRGFHCRPTVPENSLPAFRRAVEHGYGAELDVHLTKDGRLAVIHDSNVERMCGVSGRVEELTAAELSSLRLAGTEETIPFLEEVLPLFAGKRPLVVELKPAGGNHDALAAATMECLDRFDVDYCMESFDPRVLLWLRSNRPEILRGQLMQNFGKHPDDLSLWNRVAMTALFYNVRTRPDFVACRFADRRLLPLWLYRQSGGRLAWWTLHTPEELAEADRQRDLPIFEEFEPQEARS